MQEPHNRHHHTTQSCKGSAANILALRFPHLLIEPWRGVFFATLMAIRGGIPAETIERQFLKKMQELEDRYTLPDTWENEYTLEKEGTPWSEGMIPMVRFVDCGGDARL
jgi:hypothetical protein